QIFPSCRWWLRWDYRWQCCAQWLSLWLFRLGQFTLSLFDLRPKCVEPCANLAELSAHRREALVRLLRCVAPQPLNPPFVVTVLACKGAVFEFEVWCIAVLECLDCRNYEFSEFDFG